MSWSNYLFFQGDENDVPPAPPMLARVFSFLTVREVKSWLASTFGAAPEDYRITSTLRDADHNAEVGGASNSAHLSGLAVDVVLGPSFPASKAEVVAAWPFGYAYSAGHVHLGVSRLLALSWARRILILGGAAGVALVPRLVAPRRSYGAQGVPA